MKNETELNKELSKEISRIMHLDSNKVNYQEFQNTIKDIKPKSCIVKIGWVAGKYIDFTLKYEKNGINKPFDLFIESIENKAETHGFICGLNPEIFHFDTNYIINDNENLIMMFKLKRNE